MCFPGDPTRFPCPFMSLGKFLFSLSTPLCPRFSFKIATVGNPCIFMKDLDTPVHKNEVLSQIPVLAALQRSACQHANGVSLGLQGGSGPTEYRWMHLTEETAL